MVAKEQAYYLAVCVLVGFAAGLVWQLLSCIKAPFRRRGVKKIVEVWVDILFFMAFAVCCSLLSADLNYPSPRPYMYVGYALGLIIYSKTIKISLDFLKNICYNTITKLLRRKKSSSKDEEKV